MSEPLELFNTLREALAEENPKALYADGFEEALIGVARRCGQPTLAVYDINKAVEILIERDGMETLDAYEHLEINVVGAWVGPHSPIWFYDGGMFGESDFGEE